MYPETVSKRMPQPVATAPARKERSALREASFTAATLLARTQLFNSTVSAITFTEGAPLVIMEWTRTKSFSWKLSLWRSRACSASMAAFWASIPM